MSKIIDFIGVHLNTPFESNMKYRQTLPIASSRTWCRQFSLNYDVLYLYIVTLETSYVNTLF